MEYVTGIQKKETVEIRTILESGCNNQVVKVNGMVHTIRDMSEFAFIVLRKYDGLVQCVFTKGSFEFDLKTIKEGSTVEVEGVVAKEERAPHGFEIRLLNIRILSQPVMDAMLPLPIAKWKMKTSLETKVALRPISLRNVRERAIFKLQEGIVRGFRDFLYSEHFTEIRTPKIVAGNAEGGANVFKLEYFGKKAFLAQSPQTYKQTMVGVYDRVFEIGPVFRAEKHNTTRHLNEYTSVDFEMGYIDSFEEIMEMEQQMLQHTFAFLKEEYANELRILGVELPDIAQIPQVRFDRAKELVAEKYEPRVMNTN